MEAGSPILGGAAIPGDPDGLRAIAARLQAARDDVSSVQGRVVSNGLNNWTGSAGDAFRASLNKLPGELGSVAGAFDGAARAIQSFAGQLVGFQEKANYYANRIKSLEEDLSAAQDRHDQAQTQLTAARLRESAASDPISLKTAIAAVKYGVSHLQLAIDDIDTNNNEIERVRYEARENRDDYEAAVRACCAGLQDVSETSPGHTGISRIGTGVLAAFAMWLQNHGRGRAEDAYDDVDGVYGYVNDLGSFVEDVLPVSMLGRWALPIVRVAENPAFKAAGWAFLPFTLYGDFQDLRTTFDETNRENILGRFYTMEGTTAADAVMFVPVVALANAADGGALSASLHGLALIEGGAVSGGTEGAYNAYEKDTRDRMSGNDLGLVEHVVGGYADGSVHGALQGDDQFADNAEAGKYGGFIKDFAKTEDFVIEHPKAALEDAVRSPLDLAGDPYRGGVPLLSDL